MKPILRHLFGAALGGLLGFLIFIFGNPRVGIAVGILGAFVGFVLTLPGVSAGRTFKLLFATLVSYNLPVSDRIHDWVDEGSPEPEPEEEQETVTFSDKFIAWLVAADVVNRRRWPIWLGLVIGLVVGVVIAINDFAALQANDEGWVLPLPSSKDSPLTQAILLVIGCTAWGGTAFGVIAAPAFRPMLLFVVFCSCCFGGLIGLAVSRSTGPGPVAIMVFFATVIAAITLLVVVCGSSSDDE